MVLGQFFKNVKNGQERFLTAQIGQNLEIEKMQKSQEVA